MEQNSIDNQKNRLSIVFMNSIGKDIWRGGEKWMVNAASGLASKEHNITCIGRNGAVWLKKASERGLKTIELPIHADFDPFIISKLYRFFKENKTDILCCNFEKDVRLGGIAAKLAKVPQIFTRKGLTLIYDKLRYRLAYKYVVNRIITPAYHIKKQLERFPWINQNNIHVVHNGVEIPDLSQFDKSKLRRIINVTPKDQVIMGAGSLFSQKGFEYLIQGTAQLHRKVHPVHLAIAGPGDPSEYAKKAQDAGILQYVHFLGERNDVRELMYGADIFVLSSIDEGLPNVVLEALSVGTPVIAADAGGTAEIIENGKNGFIIPKRQSEPICFKTAQLLDNEDLRIEIGLKGLESVKRDFTIEKMVNSVEEVFLGSLRKN